MDQLRQARPNRKFYANRAVAPLKSWSLWSFPVLTQDEAQQSSPEQLASRAKPADSLGVLEMITIYPAEEFKPRFDMAAISDETHQTVTKESPPVAANPIPVTGFGRFNEGDKFWEVDNGQMACLEAIYPDAYRFVANRVGSLGNLAHWMHLASPVRGRK